MPLSMTLEPVQKQQLTQHLIQQMNLLQMTSEGTGCLCGKGSGAKSPP